MARPASRRLALLLALGLQARANPSQGDDDAPYDCQGPMKNWESAERYWCCKSRDVGCPGAAAPAPAKQFDCNTGVATWERSWTEDKKRWCCSHVGVGCAAGGGASTTSAPFLCKATNAAELLSWPADQRDWCCRHAKEGCPDHMAKALHKPVSFVCDESSIKAWSGEQHEWCCLHQGKGCHAASGTAAAPPPLPPPPATAAVAAVPTPEPFDCDVQDSGPVGDWSQQQQAWCCARKHVGCPAAPPAPPGKPPKPYNCSFGQPAGGGGGAGEGHGWSIDKQVWCCLNENKGCAVEEAEEYDCRASEGNWPTEWKATQRAWCCRRERRGCPTALEIAMAEQTEEASMGCSAMCVFAGQHASCGQRVKYAIEHRFHNEPGACAMARTKIAQECHMCNACTLELLGCEEQAERAPAASNDWGMLDAPQAGDGGGEAPAAVPDAVGPLDAAQRPQRLRATKPADGSDGGRPSPMAAAEALRAAAMASEQYKAVLDRATLAGLEAPEDDAPVPAAPEVRAPDAGDEEGKEGGAADAVGDADLAAAGDGPTETPAADPFAAEAEGVPAEGAEDTAFGGAPAQMSETTSKGCNTVCECAGHDASCKVRVQYLADSRFSQEQDACAAALDGVLADCPCCSVCRIEEAECQVTPRPYDCSAGFETWESSWSDAKKDYCCGQVGRGCPPMPEQLAFDCMDGFANWALQWSADKQAWCCKQQGLGCLTSAGTSAADAGGGDGGFPRLFEAPSELVQRARSAQPFSAGTAVLVLLASLLLLVAALARRSFASPVCARDLDAEELLESLE